MATFISVMMIFEKTANASEYSHSIRVTVSKNMFPFTNQ